MYHVVILNNIAVPSGWTSHIVSIFQYINRIFSNKGEVRRLLEGGAN